MSGQQIITLDLNQFGNGLVGDSVIMNVGIWIQQGYIISNFPQGMEFTLTDLNGVSYSFLNNSTSTNPNPTPNNNNPNNEPPYVPPPPYNPNDPLDPRNQNNINNNNGGNTPNPNPSSNPNPNPSPTPTSDNGAYYFIGLGLFIAIVYWKYSFVKSIIN